MPKVFICYRREDSAYPAHHIYVVLKNHYGADSVVFDVDTIPLGADFREYLNDQVSRCDVLLAVIGDKWAEMLKQRIDDADDFVRIEIQAALERQIPIVPVLVGKASVPSAKNLPPQIERLAFKQAAEVRAGPDLQTHLNRLNRGLDRLFTERKAEEELNRKKVEEKRKAEKERKHKEAESGLNAMVEVPTGDFIYQDGMAKIKKPYKGKNPIAARAAELSPPGYTVDVTRHLLIDISGQPVSVVPAASLGTLDKLRFIVVHFSAGTAMGSESYFLHPESRASVHVMIARDGTVKQLVPFDFAAHHAGLSRWKDLNGLNRYSVAIDLENWGQLERKNDNWVAWNGREVPTTEVASEPGSQKGWHKYTNSQIRSFFFVACALRKAYPSIEDILGHAQISFGRENDPGPAFPLEEMRKRLFSGTYPETYVHQSGK